MDETTITHKQEEETKKIAMFCTGGIGCKKATAAVMDLAQQQLVSYFK